MGIKEFFNSAERQKKRLDKFVRTITNPYTQSLDRYEAMEQLLADGSDEALVGLFRRFTVTSTKSIEDEEEKGWVYRKLSAHGARVLPAAKAFCLGHDSIAWALRIIEDVADAEQEWAIIEALLDKHPPEYERDPSAKIQLLTHLAEIDDPRVPAILTRYLEDPDETVRYFVAEQLIDIAAPESIECLVERLCNPSEDSVRLRTRLLDGLADRAWDVSAHIARIAKVLGNEHLLKDGKVTRR